MANPLTAGQATFVSRLAANTGLNQGVLKAWVLAEESSGAAQSRQAANNHNWLNIGYFDSGPGVIAHAAAFSNPVSAADATAKFLKGQWGGASTGIRGILHTVGSNPMNQINAIAHSGWASSGYNGGSTLRSLFSQYGGGSLGAVAQQRTGTNSAASAPTFTSAGLSGGQVDKQAAGVQALLSAASRPINTTGKLSPDPILKNLVANVASGQYTTPSQANTKTTLSTPQVAQSVAQARSGAMPKGVSSFAGVQVAAWIKPILAWAKAHGWTGSVSSGYRTYAEQKRIYDSGVRPAAVPGTSNHEGSDFPRGAVDVTNASQLSAILMRSPYAKTLVYAGSKDPVHFSHPHGGHY